MTVKTHPPSLPVLAATAAAFTLGTAAAQADTIVQPTDVSASSEFGTAPAGRDERTIDGSGLSDTGSVDTGDPVPNSYPGHDRAGGPTMWLANGTTPTITFDLGQSYQLTGTHVWNWNGSSGGGNDKTDRGAKDVTISFSTTGTSAADASGFTGGTNVTLTQADYTADYDGEDVSFDSPVTARFVQFDINSNYGDSNFTGLSEVRFTAVPEPASLALLGLGGLVMWSRRRG